MLTEQLLLPSYIPPHSQPAKERVIMRGV